MFQSVSELFAPHPEWGPALPNHREERAMLDDSPGVAVYTTSPPSMQENKYKVDPDGPAITSAAMTKHPPSYDTLGGYDNPVIALDETDNRLSTHL